MSDITRKFAESLDLDGSEEQFLAEAVRLYQNSPLSQTPKTHRDRFPDRFDDVVYGLVRDKNNWANEGVTYDAQRLILRQYMEYLEATAVNSRNSDVYLADKNTVSRLETDRNTISAMRAQWQHEHYSFPDVPDPDVPVDQAEQYL